MGALAWNEDITKHNQRLYAQDNATAANDPYQQSDKQLTWDNADQLADKAKASEYLINNILEADCHGLLVGASMTYKTFLGLMIAHCICTGNSFMKHEVYTTGKVLYICGEGKGGLSRRLRALKLAYGDFKSNLSILKDAITIDGKPDMEKLKQAVNKVKPVLVIFDTFSSLAGETIENDNGSVANCLRLIKDTCSSQDKTSSIVVHHHGKDTTSGTRGASAFLSNVDFLFTMEKHKDLAMKTKLSCTKQKDGEQFNEILIEAEIVSLGLTNQAGEDTTSLVLKPSNLIEYKENKNLGKNDHIVFQQLTELTKKNGTKPVSKNDLEKAVFPCLNIKENSKKRTFDRAFKSLENNHKILNINDIISFPNE